MPTEYALNTPRGERRSRSRDKDPKDTKGRSIGDDLSEDGESTSGGSSVEGLQTRMLLAQFQQMFGKFSTDFRTDIRTEVRSVFDEKIDAKLTPIKHQVDEIAKVHRETSVEIRQLRDGMQRHEEALQRLQEGGGATSDHSRFPDYYRQERPGIFVINTGANTAFLTEIKKVAVRISNEAGIKQGPTVDGPSKGRRFTVTWEGDRETNKRRVGQIFECRKDDSGNWKRESVRDIDHKDVPIYLDRDENMHTAKCKRGGKIMQKILAELSPARSFGRYFHGDRCIIPCYDSDKTKTLLVAIKHHPEKGWTVHWETNHADNILRGMATERTSVERQFQMASSKAEGNWE